MKHVIRSIGHRLGLLPFSKHDHQRFRGAEMSDGYYDEAFSNSPNFQVPFYRSSYYGTWLVVADRLKRYGCAGILDVGCGPGQFAALIDDWAFPSYTGIDFSNVAIKAAQRGTPRFTFIQGDVRNADLYNSIQCDAIVCMEVLEHIEDDLGVLNCFPVGTRCLMTVPNFPWRSHVRHFSSEQEVTDRYGRFFRDFSVTRLKGVHSETDQFYLIDGIRNECCTAAAS